MIGELGVKGESVRVGVTGERCERERCDIELGV